MSNPDSKEVFSLHHDDLIQVFIGQHRQMLLSSLDGLSDAEARRQLVESKTTLLGLVKHAIFVERVWFGEAATGKSRKELGIVASPDESFELAETDTVASVQQQYLRAIELSHRATAGKSGNVLFPGNRRGPLPLRWIQIHMLRELAQHCGHADILREQIISARASRPVPTG